LIYKPFSNHQITSKTKITTKAQANHPPTMNPTLLLATIFIVHTASSLPTAPQSWAAHKRALFQLQNDIANSSTPPPPNSTSTLRPPPLAPADDAVAKLLQLLITGIRHHPPSEEIDTIALSLLPDYLNFFEATTTPPAQLKASIRHLYLTHYSELELELVHMEKLGILLRRLQLMTESEPHPPHHSHHHHHRRRPGGDDLKRIDAKHEPKWRKWVGEA
jgi:hypothetical protein